MGLGCGVGGHLMPFHAPACACPGQVEAAPSGMDENHDTPAQGPASPRSELELVTGEKLSSLFKVCTRQLCNMRMRGELPYFKLGRAVRFRIGDVVEALETREVTWPLRSLSAPSASVASALGEHRDRFHPVRARLPSYSALPTA